MRRGAEAGDGRGFDPPKRRSSGVPRMRHCIKILCQDTLVTALLGPGGRSKDALQEESGGAKLVFSGRGDYFPETQYRVLGIFADDVQCIARALGLLVPRLVQVAEEEVDNLGSELLGKELGEFVFRLCISKRMSSVLIGNSGTNIQEIRKESGAKVFIENQSQMEHRLVRVIGTPPQITLCLERLNDYVQQEVESEDFLAYAAGVSFGEASSARSPEREPRGGRGGGGGSWRDGPGGGGGGHRWEGGWRDDHRDGGSGDRWESGGGGYHQNGGYGGGGGGRGRSRSRERGGSWASEVPRSVRDAVGLLGQAVGALPAGTAEMPYSISLEVPSSTVGAVMGRSGEFVKSVEESCHVNVDIDRTEGGGSWSSASPASRRVSLVGPLLGIYAAHAVILGRVRAAEAADASRRRDRYQERRGADGRSGDWRGGGEDAGGSDQDQLRRQITDLQETLARLTGGAKGGGGGGR